jgi:hypothetical protein
LDDRKKFLHDWRCKRHTQERTNMPYADLDTARRHCQEIRELVTGHLGGTRDDRALQRLQQACRAVTSAVSDRQCRDCAGAVEDYACEVFAGAAEFRQEMLKELDALLARITALAAHRDAVGAHRAA